MKALTVAMLLIFAVFSGKAQDDWVCTTVDTSHSHVQQVINEIQDLVIVLVDFPDGRKQPGNIVPTEDSDLNLVQNLDAVGGMGWTPDSTNPGSYLKRVRKYTYEDYWDYIFSQGQYTGSRHPDFESHGIEAYGSLRDYYQEVSYGNLAINPFQTWNTNEEPTKYNTGIVNAAETVNGRRIIKWIMMPEPKPNYEPNGPLGQVLPVLDSLFESGEIEFDRNSYSGRIMVVYAGGGAGITSSLIYNVREKSQRNTTNQSTFDGILPSVHEYGHTLGLEHVIAGSYDPMNPTLPGSPIYLWCPAHLNPLTKLTKGWIAPEYIARLREGAYMSLAPVHSLPSVEAPLIATVTLYGDPGRDSNWTDHSEYFLVEYRKREGFNRFSGGQFAQSGFHGGALIWHYESLFRKLSLKVEDYSPNFQNDPGSPSHFYPEHGTPLDSASTPNSNSALDLVTGIALKDFTLSQGEATLDFELQYQIETPPEYDILVYSSSFPVTWSGAVYVQVPAQVREIASGTQADVVVGTISILNRAVGSLPNQILFRGAGYGNHRLRWNGLSTTTIDPDTTPELRYCRVENATAGVTVGAYAEPGTVYPTPIVRSFSFYDCTNDIIVEGSSRTTEPIELGGLDSNAFTRLIPRRWTKLSTANFTVASGQTLLLMTILTTSQPDPPLEDPRAPLVTVRNAHVFTIDGSLEVADSAILEGSTWKFNVDFVVAADKEIRLYPGSRLEFAQGKSVIAYGELISDGTDQDMVYFTSAATNPAIGDWNGISFSFSPQHSLSHLDISYAAIGIHADNTTLELSNSRIHHCSIGIDLGIFLDGTSAFIHSNEISYCDQGIVNIQCSPVAIDDNFIHHNNVGVTTSASCPVLHRNLIEDNMAWGVWVSDVAEPRFGDFAPDDSGNNTIRDNGFAQGTSQVTSLSSFPFFGCHEEWCGQTMGGYNSIYTTDDFNYAIEAREKSDILAHIAWWGGYPADPNLFLVDESSLVSYIFELDYDPNEGAGFAARSTEKVLNGDDGPSLSITPEQRLLFQALGLRGRRQYSQAIAIYAQLILTRPSRPEALVAVNQLRNAYRDYIRSSGQPQLHEQLREYLATQASSHINPRLRTVAKFLLGQELRVAGQQNAAAQNFSEIAATYPGTEFEKSALFSLFSVYCVDLENREMANTVLNQLVNRWAGDPRARIARVQYDALSSTRPGMSVGKLAGSDNGQETKGLPFKYHLHQNYPNPFNPETRIQFELPQESAVQLVVFDLLGREVATLVNEFMKAGRYDVTFAATNLASGVYFYRLQAGTFNDVKRLLLLK